MRVTVTFTTLHGQEGIRSFDSVKEAMDWLYDGPGLLDYDIFFS